MTKKARTDFTRGSDNVFADVGVANPEEHLLKAQLVARIQDAKNERGLNQTQLARLLGVSQPDVSKLLAGEFENYSASRLMRFLKRLDYEVSIVVAHKSGRKRGITILVP